MATKDVSVELDEFGGNRENYLLPKKKKRVERAIESSNVANPQFEFDPFGVATPNLVNVERASDEALDSIGASRDATTGELILPFTQEGLDVYDAGFNFDSDNQNNDSPTGLFDNDTSNVTNGIKYSGGVKGIVNKLTDFKESLGFGGDMAKTIITGGPPIATAMSWIATGWQQRKDQEKFLQDFGKTGFNNINMFKDGPNSQYDKTWEYAQAYGDPVKKTARDFARDIFFNNPNPSKLIKDNAYGGKNYEGSAFEATQDYIINGMKNDVFTREEIKTVADSYNSLKMGSAEWVKAKMARDALKQYSGIRSDIPSVNIHEGETSMPTPIVETKDKDTNSNNTTTQAPTPTYQTNDGYSAAGSGTQSGQPNPNTETGFSGGSNNNSGSSGSGSSGSGSSGSSSGAYAGPRNYGRQYGGKVQHLAEGDMVQADAGNMEIVNEPGKDNSGVADDVPKKLEEGDFVVNAPASEMMGYSDLLKMIKGAEGELSTQGVKVNYGTPDGEIDVRVSNKETIIPKIIAQQIGYDKLEKINNRGKKRVSEIEQANKGKEEQQGFMPKRVEPQKPEQPQGMLAAVGGQVSLDENKNQPIAVPQEGFAGQSSVGNKLLSPMSPEAQDDEKELANKSQSFEGFMKPIKLAEGDKVQQNPTRADRNNNPFNMESNVNTNKFFGSIGNDIENLSVDMPKNGFLKFDTFDNGLRAGAYILRKQYNNMNADEIMKTFSLTDKASYAQAIKNTFGNNKINTQDDNQLLELLKIITNQEGTEQKINEDQFKNAIRRAKDNLPNATWSTQGIKKQLTNTINPSGMMGK